MSDPSNPVDANSSVASPSAGALLRQARERMGWSVESLATLLKVVPAKVQAIEADDWAKLGEPVFVRTLALSICRVTKTEPGPILAGLPARPNPALKTDAQRTQAVYAPTGGSVWRMGLRQPEVLLGLVMALAIAAVLLWPGVPAEDARPMATSEPALAPQPVGSEPAAAVVSPMAQTVSVSQSLQAAPMLKEASALGSGGAVPGAAPTALASPVPVPSGSAAASAATVSVPSGLDDPGKGVRIAATGDAWVEVLDAQGGVLLRRLFKAGESSIVSGSKPYRITVGRSDLVSVWVDGRALDLAPHSKNNVARLEVKP